ncbi:peptidase inhibitor family I36 protein [Streptomyces sp. QTS52]
MSSYEQEHDRKSSRSPRRALVAASLTFATATLGLIAPGSASATSQAWECASGSLCIHTGAYGTGSRCSWSNADPDWYSGSVQCSWSDTRNVGSAYNPAARRPRTSGRRSAGPGVPGPADACRSPPRGRAEGGHQNVRRALSGS